MRFYRKRTTNVETHPGFDDYYATQVRKVDACFGRFIEKLKEKNLDENSIIILTSDHGEDLGEGGRYGHGFYLYPELIRVPLIMRLPEHLKKGMRFDTNSIAFLTDITPTIYYLLGQRPIVRNGVFGRPLFTHTQKEQTDYLEPFYLLGSSYGAIWGILGKGGKTLFISDSTVRQDYFFDLDRDPLATTNQINGQIQAENRKLVHDYILEVNKFYNFSNPALR
jgi:arylsulfatase A-like enzyme